MLFENQYNVAANIIAAFDTDKYLILEAECQIGKTGAFCALCNLIEENDAVLSSALGINKIYYLTGDNSKALTPQSEKSYMEDVKVKCINIKFIKQSEMKSMIKNKEKCNFRNSLIFIDESHYGTSKEENILSQFLKLNGIICQRYENCHEELNTYLVSCSATTFIEKLSDIIGKKPIVHFDVPPSYRGVKHFFENNQIRTIDNNFTKDEEECFDLFVNQILPHIKKYKNKKCVIARYRNSKKDINIISLLEKYYTIKEYDSTSSNIDYEAIEDKILAHCELKKDEKPLLILIKGAYRMGIQIKPMIKDYIGAVVDYTSTKDNYNATIQGLLGRMCGHIIGRKENEWKKTLFFINKEHYKPLKEFYVDGKYNNPYSHFMHSREVEKQYHPIIQKRIAKYEKVLTKDELFDIVGVNWPPIAKSGEKKLVHNGIIKLIETFAQPKEKDYLFLGGRQITNETAVQELIDINANFNRGWKHEYCEENIGKIGYSLDVDRRKENEIHVVWAKFEIIHNPISMDEFLNNFKNSKLEKLIKKTYETNIVSFTPSRATNQVEIVA